MTLMHAESDRIYRIVSVSGDGDRHRRLLDMGFTPGSEVYVACYAPFGGTVLVSLRGFSVALRENAADLINVECADGL